MAIVVLALWIVAAAAGVTLLRAGGAARRRGVPMPAEPVPAEIGPAQPAVARIGALPMTADGKPPRGPHVRVTSQPGEHPFLEFCHPALAITGVACWLMFVLVHYRPFAWIAVGILVATMAVGLSWLAAGRRDGSHGATMKFPPRLIVLHGLAVTLAIALTVLTAITATS